MVESVGECALFGTRGVFRVEREVICNVLRIADEAVLLSESCSSGFTSQGAERGCFQTEQNCGCYAIHQGLIIRA